MRLIKSQSVLVYTFAVSEEPGTGRQNYKLLATRQVLASIHPYTVRKMVDFQVDWARIKDHLLIYTNELILTDQSEVVKVQGNFYLPTEYDDTNYTDPRDGYFKTILKLNIDPAYGLQ